MTGQTPGAPLALHADERQLLNQVERVFADLTAKQLRRGVFRSVAALERAARENIHARNEDAKPINWTADADTILRRVAQKRATSSESEHYALYRRA